MTRSAAPVRVLMLVAVAVLGGAGATVAQSPRAVAYDVASIKVNKSGSGNTSVSINSDRYTASNVPLKSLIENAYGLATDDLIFGLPGWANSANFDIAAKMDAETVALLKAGSKEDSIRMRRTMMQGLLADRFGLKAHRETKELPVYALVVAKGGSKLKAGDPADPHAGGMHSNNQNLTATGIEMGELCSFLSGRLHRQVEDKTGLTGKYDFTLHWSPDEAAGDSPAATGASQAPSIYTAVQEQLGLKLDATKGPVDTIVVDHVEMASEN